ncbi:MAG: hypothetical protein HY287_03080 [Planctomycetes bacterium]|nr:hypothetical protein [Planctomycetota bacterium]
MEYLDGSCARGRWEYPGEPIGIPGFVHSALEAMEPWNEIRAYRRSDTWRCTDEDELEGRICTLIFRAIGIGPDDSVAFLFSKSDLDALVMLVFATICFGWCVYDDLFLVPDHGQQILYFDHHDVVHVSFKDGEHYGRFLAKMGPAATA